MKKRFLSLVLIFISITTICWSGVSTQKAQAQVPGEWTIKVNTFEDLRDFAQNGVCSAGDITEGPCSLRAALNEAYILNNWDVTIELPPGEYHLTLTEPSYEDEEDVHFGDWDIPGITTQRTHALKIIGTGGPDNPSILDADFADRVLDIGEN